MTKSTLLEIDKDDACLGMFVHGFGQQWLNSPFAASQFKLTSPAELKALRESPVRTLVIDLSRGVGPTRSGSARPRSDEDLASANISAALKKATGMVRSIFSSASTPIGVDRQQVESVVDIVDELICTRPTTVLRLTKLKSKDETSFQHSIAVCALVSLFARYLKLDSKLVQMLCVGGLLHDIGKVFIPSAILTKSEMLTPSERAVMQTHPRRGYEMLARGSGLPDIVGKVCLHHHEKLDGSGYPDGLKDDEIGAAVRIVAICDVFDALTSVRSYKKGSTPEAAASMMATWTGHFDQMLLRKFFDCMGLQWPNGSTQLINGASEASGPSQPDLDDFQFLAGAKL